MVHVFLFLFQLFKWIYSSCIVIFLSISVQGGKVHEVIPMWSTNPPEGTTQCSSTRKELAKKFDFEEWVKDKKAFKQSIIKFVGSSFFTIFRATTLHFEKWLLRKNITAVLSHQHLNNNLTHFLIWSSRAWSLLCAGFTLHTIFILSSRFFFTMSLNKVCSFSYSSSQVVKTSKQETMIWKKIRNNTS